MISRQLKWQRQMLALGLCRQCGGVRGQLQLCEKCASLAAARSRKYRAKRIARGKCVGCGRRVTAARGHTMCKGCLERMRVRSMVHRRKDA